MLLVVVVEFFHMTDLCIWSLIIGNGYCLGMFMFYLICCPINCFQSCP